MARVVSNRADCDRRAAFSYLAMDMGQMMDILNCPDCGGTHYGSSECPIKYPPSPIDWPKAAPLKCKGVGRDKNCISALEFYFDRRVSDDEMRYLHDVIRQAAACIRPVRCEG